MMVNIDKENLLKKKHWKYLVGFVVSNSTFPTLSSTCQQLEHSAARDRISVKNKRRQPIKQKVRILIIRFFFNSNILFFVLFS